MPIPVTCPHCGKTGRAPDHASGGTVRCTRCKSTFLAPVKLLESSQKPWYEELAAPTPLVPVELPSPLMAQPPQVVYVQTPPQETYQRVVYTDTKKESTFGSCMGAFAALVVISVVCFVVFGVFCGGCIYVANKAEETRKRDSELIRQREQQR